MILKNCTFFNEDFEKEFGDIKIENGKISEIGFFPENGKDMSGKIIIPGFVDVHIHGANGADAMDNSYKSLEKMSEYLAKNGVTSFCPTTMTQPIEKLEETAEYLSNYKQNGGAKIAGINFEGPYISKEKRGAQNIKFIKEGNVEEVKGLFEKSKRLMKIITIAPEAFDSKDFISECKNICTVSIGHTNADFEECKTAIENGAAHITHLYNAMTPMASRKPGVVGAALDSEVTCELICDGEHISPAVLRNTFKILGEDRAVVVSDSMAAAGLGEGEYELGGQKVFVKDGDGVARLESGAIAASITNVYLEFKNLLKFGIDFKTALKSCTINPSKVIKADDKIGSVSKGKYADLVVLNENLSISEVYINGTLA